MGVTGLWKLLEPCGKPVPLESLEDKVLAVDVSIWLNQVLKGYRDSQNNTLPNAHLVGVFHRVCKLLTYRIKPVFVFDGGVPALKRDTLSARRLRKRAASQAAERTSRRLVHNLLHQQAMREVLGAAAPLPLSVSGAGRADPFHLPPLPAGQPSEVSDSDSSESEAEAICDRLQHDLHSFDFESEQFRCLAPQVKHDILSDLKDTRKQNSWGKLNHMPKEADDFSDFQMERLRKRRKFQSSMDEVEAEITKRNTELLHMGIDLPGTATAQSMASRAGTYLVLSQTGAERQMPVWATNRPEDNAAAPAAAKQEQPQQQEEEENEAALVEAADTAEYLSGADLFGGGGRSAGGSAARVDRRLDELKKAGQAAGGRGADAQADTALVFSEMGKKYSNLYLKFSAQWLEDEKKVEDKAKKESPQKRKAPEPTTNDALAAKKPPPKAAKLKVPTLEELTKDLARISADRKRSRPSRSKEPPPPAPQRPRKSSQSTPVPADDGVPTPVSRAGHGLTISIDPRAAPADDLFQDVFSPAAAAETEPGVALMSDSDDSCHETAARPRGTGGAAARDDGAPAQQEGGAATRQEQTGDGGDGSLASQQPLSSQLATVVPDSDCNWEPCEPAVKTERCCDTPQSKPEPRQLARSEVKQEEDSVGHGSAALMSSPAAGESASSRLPPHSPPVGSGQQTNPPFPADAQSEEDPDSPPVAAPSDGDEPSAPLSLPVSPRRSGPASGAEVAADTAATAAGGPPVAVWDGMDDAELRDLAEQLAADQMALLDERGRQQRGAATVSDDMYGDVQTLLELFGIPYVVSPKEAEAQCAFLEIIGLTEGTITDDSDIWLFGGRRVYKNFFNQKKFVEFYQAGDIQGSLGLTRGQLVCVALLTGSDYTLGVESVGCVRALEILAEFPGDGLSGLHAFKRWWDASRSGQAAAARTPIRRSLASLQLSQGFPSEAVMQAYLEPEVDTSREPFSWAAPDLDGLRHLAAAKFGWGGKHTDTILLPVMERSQQKQGQRRLEAFFPAAYRQEAPLEGSRRLRQAVRRVRGDEPEPADGGSGHDPAQLERLMEDGLDELLAGLDEPDEAAGLTDAPETTGAEASGSPPQDTASRPLPDLIPAPPSAARKPAKRPAGRGGRGRARTRKPAPVDSGTDRRPPPVSAAAVTAGVSDVAESSDRRAAEPAAPTPLAPPRSAVPTELAGLDAVSRQRVLLVRRLRERADLVRSQLRQEQADRPRAAPRRPTTREVRARMLTTLLQQNPRMRLERSAQLRRRLGLTPAGRGRSCRDPAARREEASFAEALAAGDGDEADRVEGQRPEAEEPATVAGLDRSTAESLASAAAGGQSAAGAEERPTRDSTDRPQRPATVPRARSAAADLRLPAAAAADRRPLPALHAAAEEVTQRQLSERCKAEARRQAAQLLNARGAAGGRRRQRASAAAARRPRPRPAPRATGLSESSDSD